VRTSAYFAFQSGVCGYGYGANGVWNDLYSKDGDFGTAFEMPERYMNWYDGANLEGAVQMTHLKEFYSAVKWWKLIPEAFFSHTVATLDREFSAACSSDGNDTFIVYFYEQNDSTGALNGLARGAVYHARWFDPRSGRYTAISQFVAVDGHWRIPKKPTAEDWLLIVKRVGQNG